MIRKLTKYKKSYVLILVLIITQKIRKKKMATKFYEVTSEEAEQVEMADFFGKNGEKAKKKAHDTLTNWEQTMINKHMSGFDFNLVQEILDNACEAGANYIEYESEIIKSSEEVRKAKAV